MSKAERTNETHERRKKNERKKINTTDAIVLY